MTTTVDIENAAANTIAATDEPVGVRQRYLDFSLLGLPELALCLAGPALLVTLFLVPWFSATGFATVRGHHGSVTGWQTYHVLRYFVAWCGVGAFILPWMVARRHQTGWRRGEMTAVHGMIGFALLVLNGIGFRPGSAPEAVHIQIGYWIALGLMLVLLFAGVRSADRHLPLQRKPPGI